jgi:hypothetical protein
VRRLLYFLDRRPYMLYRIAWLLIVSPLVIIPALGWLGVPLATSAMTAGFVVTYYAARYKLRNKARGIS